MNQIDLLYSQIYLFIFASTDENRLSQRYFQHIEMPKVSFLADFSTDRCLKMCYLSVEPSFFQQIDFQNFQFLLKRRSYLPPKHKTHSIS